MTDLDIFINAPDDLTESQLASYFEEACGGDEQLRARVEALVAANRESSAFMEKPAAGSLPTIDIPSVDEQPDEQIGPYKLLEQIGEGGMSVVYVAQQEQPIRRRVAIKVIKPGMDSKEVIARFSAERQALALMDHPNIATVHDAGTTESGRPYFVMELVRGIPITEYCDLNRATPRERLELFVSVCQAVQHAHQKGIIHRDIKPSNVMITEHDGTPVVKVIDFGVAKAINQKLSEQTVYTRHQQMVGTPLYMSPEQAELSGLDVDTRSDIYSLGVLLYELLTGTTPFEKARMSDAPLDEIRRIIREEEPSKPSTKIRTLGKTATSISGNRRTDPKKLSQFLRGDLDWIVMKCLEKDRTRRYDTAHGVAQDLKRHLTHEPVLARPPSKIYRFRKAWQRNKTACTAGIAVLLALVAGIGVAAVGWYEALDQRDVAVEARAGEEEQRKQAESNEEQAEMARKETRLRAYTAEMNVAFQALDEHNLGRARELLDRQRPQPGEEDLRGLEWRHLWDLCQGDELTTFRDASSTSWFYSASFSPDGKLLAFAAGQKTVIREVASRSVVKTLSHAAITVAFSPRGDLLASAGYTEVKIWDTGTWGEVKSFSGSHFPAIFSPDGHFLVTGAKGGFRVWNTETWEPAGFCKAAENIQWHLRHAIAFSPDGKLLFTPGNSGLGNNTENDTENNIEARTLKFQVWKFPSLEPLPSFASFPDRLGSAVFLSADNRLLTGQFDGSLRVWDVATGKIVETHRQHTGWVTAIVTARDGKTFVTASTDRSIVIWDAAKIQPLTRLRGHLAEIWALALSADGRLIASASQDGLAKLWNPATRRGPSDLIGAHKTVGFIDDGRLLVAASSKGLMLSDVVSGETSEIPISGMHDPSYSSNYPADVERGGSLVVVGLGSKLELWNATTRAREASWDAFDESTKTGQTISTVAFSPDGRHVAAASTTGLVKVWDVATQGEVARFKASISTYGDLAFSPDSKLLALGRNAHVIVWNVALGRETLKLGPHNGDIRSIEFSPDGRLLAAAALQGNEANLWEIPSGKSVATLRGHVQGVVSVAFTPDGKTLATGSHDRRVKLWNVATRQEMATLPLDGIILSLVFSHDGRSLAAGHEDKPRIRLWHVPSFEEIDAAESRSPPARAQIPLHR